MKKKFLSLMMIMVMAFGVFALTGCGGSDDSAESDTPVSYTHLDVYKRQVLSLQISYPCLSDRFSYTAAVSAGRSVRTDRSLQIFLCSSCRMLKNAAPYRKNRDLKTICMPYLLRSLLSSAACFLSRTYIE